MKKNNSDPSKHSAMPGKKSSSALAASKAERPTTRVKPAATRDVNGASGMRNTGTNVSYEDKE